ncbi:MAG: UPF0236 family protein [Lactococcus hircilactis]|uniref:UPF0236 family transposase-like protein n=1 Tax=Lactococcus hircilactis TaxID=1494462 RepID=UPI003BBA55CB
MKEKSFELRFEEWRNKQTKAAFLKSVEEYDEFIYEKMKKKDWVSNGFKERTISMVWGTVTFRRRTFKKGKAFRVPVDEHFGFEKSQRVSMELLIKIAKLAIDETYSAVCRTIWELYHVDISIWTVYHAIDLVAGILEKREQYRYLEELEIKKICPKIIFIEGDGVMFRTNHSKILRQYWADYAHFVVHTGVVETTKDRFECENKLEFFGSDLKVIRQQVIQHILNTMEITPETIFVTNSDGGKGYSAKAFKDMVSELSVSRYQRHEHFWDRYHVREKVEYKTRAMPEVGEAIMQAIYAHDKEKLNVALDTMESKITARIFDYEDEEEQAQGDFQKFKNKLLYNFKYLETPEHRGLSPRGIGVIESNHRKITFRAKFRGMHWSKKHLVAIAQLTILKGAKLLDDLFYGDWQAIYEQYEPVDSDYRQWFKRVQEEYEPPQGILWGNFDILEC